MSVSGKFTVCHDPSIADLVWAHSYIPLEVKQETNIQPIVKLQGEGGLVSKIFVFI